MKNDSYSKGQLNALVLLRLFIGWHFLYEGLIKLLNPSWTAKGYLAGSSGPFKGLFQWLAGDAMIGAIDFLNIALLILVGLSLTLGFWTKLFSYFGIGLLILYYLAYPPLPGWEVTGPSEGSYFLINKNLIEAAALAILVQFPTASYFGVELLFKKKLKNNPTT
ncbi:MAG: DoxX family membrane protein [Cytophagales bacterium]|nr:DoxX family membrane protein [Cytophagales bacterium]